MVRRALVLSAVVVSLGLTASAAIGAPVDRDRFGPRSFDSIVFWGAPSSCSTFPELDMTPEQGDLDMVVQGWIGPYWDEVVEGAVHPMFGVHLTANVSGSIGDADGNIYTVVGHFREDGARSAFADTDVAFRGVGQLVVTGPAGTYVGKATAAAVDGPPERQFSFTTMSICKAR